MAAGLLAEAEGLDLGIREETLPYIPLRLAAWRGQASTALDLVEVMMRGARTRGEGCAITAAQYATAILYNGLGQYEPALDAAQKATASDDIVTSSWALYELVEAASRTGQRQAARDAVDRLSERTSASGTAWAKGTEAHSRALVEDGEAAEELHRQAVRVARPVSDGAHLARARLSYGEWLRRENRRVDAREQLRGAYDVFASMGAVGFADRARRELLATARRCASAATTLAMSSRPRRSTSRDLPATDGRIQRSARSYTSAPAPSNGTCARCSRSSGSAHATACTVRCRAETAKPRPRSNRAFDRGIHATRRPVAQAWLPIHNPRRDRRQKGPRRVR